MTPEKSVLGASSINFSGSPLIPPEVITIYFVIFFTLLFIIYYFLHRKRQPVHIRHKVKLLLMTTVGLKLMVLVGGGLLAGYWLAPRPNVLKSTPKINAVGYAVSQKIEIIFDRPVARRQLTKKITPEIPGIWLFENSVYGTHLYRRLVFYPTINFKPDKKYEIKLSNIQNAIKTSDSYDYSYTFTTQKIPEIKSVTPTNNDTNFPINSPIVVNLTQSNDRISDYDFILSPPHAFDVSFSADKKSYTLVPIDSLKQDTQYQLMIKRTDLTYNLPQNMIIERSETKDVYNATFITGGSTNLNSISNITTNAQVQATSLYPEDGWNAVSVEAPIKITFDQEVIHESAQIRFSTTPNIEGTFSWEGRTMIFTPKSPFSYSATYKASLAPGVRNKIGLLSTQTYSTSFTSQEETVKLTVPAFLQQHTLSCELAALRMALAYKGHNVSEEKLLQEVGVDWTAHNGNIWGDPYEAFVGNVDGNQMADGYGVYWGPIARVARKYRSATEFEGADIKRLTEAISQGHAVVIWVYSGGGWPTSWHTPGGKYIYAARDEHAVTAVGYVGTASNPSQIIINDPLIGQVYWPRALFDSKWKIFNNSGVIVY